MEESYSSLASVGSGPVPNIQHATIQIRGLSTTAPWSPKHVKPHHLRSPSEDSLLLPPTVERQDSESPPPSITADLVASLRGEHKLVCNWKNLLTTAYLWLSYLTVSAAYSIIGPFFPSEADAMGSTPTVTGLIVSSSPLCVFLLSPLLGYLLPRLGLKFTLLAGLFLVGGAFLLLGFVSEVPSGWIFILFCLLLRMTEGVGSAMYLTATFTLVAEFYPTRVGTVMGMFELAGGLGFAIGPVVGGTLYQLGGFRLPFFSVGGFILLSVIPCFILVRSSNCSAHVLSPRLIWKLMTNFVIFVLAMANILTMGALSFFTPVLEPFLKEQFNLNPFNIGLIFLCCPVVYMFSSLIVGLLSDKLGQRKFIITGFMLFGVSYFFVGPADFIGRPQVWITCVAFSITGVGAAMGSIPVYADMLKIAKRIVGESDEIANTSPLVGVVSGIVSSTLSCGEFLGPIVSGTLMEFFDLQTSSLIFGEILLAEGFLVLGVTLINKFCHRRT